MSHSKGKWIKCNEETDGFFGLYRAPAEMTGKGRCAMILPSDDNADDHLAKSELKWAHELGIGALTISPNKQDTGLHDWPVEHFESAVKFLKSKGHTKIGVLGLSSGSLMALTAASLIEDITLTIALTPVDFILGGYLHDIWTEPVNARPRANQPLRSAGSGCRICRTSCITRTTGTVPGRNPSVAVP